MKFFTFFNLLFLFFIQNSFTQETIEGKVIDSVSKKPIDYATIIYLNREGQASYTDSLGNYKIEPIAHNEVLQISCIGYQSLSINIKNLSKAPIIKLSPIIYMLNVVEINNKKRKTFQLGYFKNKHKNIGYGSIGLSKFETFHNYIAAYIPNSKKDSALFITKLLYNLNNNPKALDMVLLKLNLKPTPCQPTRLRVHLFTINPKNSLPDKELLKENIVLRNDCTQDDLIVDVAHQNILMPANGLFIALEYIDLPANTKGVYYPFYVTKFGSKVPNAYESFQQKKWINVGIGGSHQVQFGIEVCK